MANPTHIPPPPPEEEAFAGHIPPPPPEEQVFNGVNPENFAVHQRGGALETNTLNVPAGQGDKALGQIAESSRRVASKSAPVVVPAAASMLLGPQAGFAARTAMAGLGGAAGEAGRQVLEATGGNIEPSPLEAAKKIGTAGATNAAFSAGTEGVVGTIGAGLDATKNVVHRALEFFGDVAKGTAKTASKIPSGAVVPVTEDAIGQFAGDIASTVEKTKKAAGDKIQKAFEATDKASPEGVLPVRTVMDQLRSLAGKLRTKAAIPGADQPTQNAMGKTEEYIQRWIEANPGRSKLTLQEAKDLLDRAREGVKFEATMPGAAGAGTRRTTPFSGWLRGKIGEINPSAGQALDHYAKLIDDADFLKEATGVVGGEPVTPALVRDMEGKLKRFLKTGEVTDQILDRVMGSMGRSDLAKRGQGLAVSQQLSGSGSAGELTQGMVAGATRGAASPVTRKVFVPVAKLADKIQLPAGAGATLGKTAGGLAGALSKKKGDSNGR